MAGNDSYSVNEILLTADTLAKAGGVVPAISLLEAAVKSTNHVVLPMDIVRVRMRLADMYEAYTYNTDAVKEHLVRALKAITTNQVASKKVNAIRVVIYLRLVDGQAMSQRDQAMKDVEFAIKICQDAHLHELLPRGYMAKAHLLVLNGQDDLAHQLLASAQQAAAHAGSPQALDHQQLPDLLHPLSVLSHLLGAHLHLRRGRMANAAACLDKAKTELVAAPDCPRELLHSSVASGNGEGHVTLAAEFSDKGKRDVAELTEYFVVLSAIHAMCTGDMGALPGMLLSASCLARGLWGHDGASRGHLGGKSLLRWESGLVYDGMVSFVRSHMIANSLGSKPTVVASQPTPKGKEKPPSFLKLSEAEVTRAIQKIQETEESVVKQGEETAGVDAAAASATFKGPTSFTLGYNDTRAKHLIALLLYQRKAELQISQADFGSALETIGNMKRRLDLARQGGALHEKIRNESGAALHCTVAHYCTRLGIVDKALVHLQRAEQRTGSISTRIQAMLQRAVILVESPNTIDQSVMDPATLVEEVDKLLQADVNDLGGGCRCTLAYLRAKLEIGKATQDDIPKMYETKEMLDRVILEAKAASCDKKLEVQLAVLKGEYMYRIGQFDPEVHVTMVEQSIECLGKAHSVVTDYGDIWLELKVLRGLERGYVQVPSRAKVAAASATIMKSREKKMGEASAAVLGSRLHNSCIVWDLGTPCHEGNHMAYGQHGSAGVQ